MDAARAALRVVRTEENRLLAERVQADQSAGRRHQLVAFGLVTVAIALLGLIGWLFMRAARRQRHDTDALRHAKNELALQVDARSANLRESNGAAAFDHRLGGPIWRGMSKQVPPRSLGVGREVTGRRRDGIERPATAAGAVM